MTGRYAILAALAASLCNSAALAQVPPEPAPSAVPDTLSLSDEQKADVLSHNTESSVDAARAGLGTGAPSRQIHGEMGVLIGTHGTRAAYGTAAIPIGDSAGAVVSVETSHYGYKPR